MTPSGNAMCTTVSSRSTSASGPHRIVRIAQAPILFRIAEIRAGQMIEPFTGRHAMFLHDGKPVTPGTKRRRKCTTIVPSLPTTEVVFTP